MAGLLSPDPVATALRRWASEPFDPAGDNCGMAVLRYVQEAGGNVRAAIRRLFGARMFAELGADRAAFLAAAEAAMAGTGWQRTDHPRRGDVGMVELPTGLTAAICVGGTSWAARGARAAVIQHGVARIAWRRPCPRQ